VSCAALRAFSSQNDRVIEVRLHQMHDSNQTLTVADVGIARTEANGLIVLAIDPARGYGSA
jgi:hypothetical protein